MTECHRLRHVPLRELTVEDLRLLIGQNMSLEYTVPLALEILAADPLAEGDFYPGDLLAMVRKVPEDFWAGHPQLRDAWENIRKQVP